MCCNLTNPFFLILFISIFFANDFHMTSAIFDTENPKLGYELIPWR